MITKSAEVSLVQADTNTVIALRAFVRYSCIYEACMILNGSSAIRRFKHSDAIEICDGITYNFYTGLPDLEYAHQLLAIEHW